MIREEIDRLLANGENSRVEFKSDKIRPESLAKEIVALANTHGGIVLLGINDDGEVVGTTRENLDEWLSDTVIGRYTPPSIIPLIEHFRYDADRSVTVITIEDTYGKPFSVREKDRETVYIRIGSVSRIATRDQIIRLCSASGLSSAESLPVPRSSLSSLDEVRLERYFIDILHEPDMPKSKDEWVVKLKNLGFMTEGLRDSSLCTIAGLVLFGIKPRNFLKQAGLRLMVFDSTDKQYQAIQDTVIDAPLIGRYSREYGNQLIDEGIIEKCLSLIRQYITLESDHIDENFRRPLKWCYPYEAVRELLINAFAHRDWTRSNEIELVIYSDRIELTSPGALPNSMTVEKMIAGQRTPRNQLIVDVLRDYAYVDARGMGIRTKVIPLTHNSGGHCDFIASEDYLRTVLNRPTDTDHVGKEVGTSERDVGKNTEMSGIKPENVRVESKMSERGVGKERGVSEKILALIKADSGTTIREMAESTGVSSRTVERYLEEMTAQGILKRIGGKRYGTWKIME